jgi:hypothetical protein
MMPAMPGLTARLATRPPPQAALLVVVRWLLGVPVRRRRPGRVARVLIKPRPQLRDDHFQLSDPRRLLGDQRLKLGIQQTA